MLLEDHSQVKKIRELEETAVDPTAEIIHWLFRKGWLQSISHFKCYLSTLVLFHKNSNTPDLSYVQAQEPSLYFPYGDPPLQISVLRKLNSSHSV